MSIAATIQQLIKLYKVSSNYTMGIQFLLYPLYGNFGVLFSAYIYKSMPRRIVFTNYLNLLNRYNIYNINIYMSIMDKYNRVIVMFILRQ